MGCTWMTVAGGALGILGFGLVVFQLARAQRQEFGWPRFLLRSLAWVRRKIRRLLRRPTVVKLGGASVTARGGVSARGSVRRGMGPDSPDRLGAIEFNLTELEQEFRERVNELEQEVPQGRAAG